MVSGYSNASISSGNASNAVTLTLNNIARTGITVIGATGAAGHAAPAAATINLTPSRTQRRRTNFKSWTTRANDATGILEAMGKLPGGNDFAANNGRNQVTAYTWL